LYPQDIQKKFEQILIKLGGFYVSKINLVQTVMLSTSTPKISVEIHICRYSKDQIPTDISVAVSVVNYLIAFQTKPLFVLCQWQSI